MKVVIVDHPKILGFLLRMYYHIPKVKEEQVKQKRQLDVQLPFLYFCSLYIICNESEKKNCAVFLFVV